MQRAIGCFLLVIFVVLFLSSVWAGNIYYFKDKDGVLHFTDLPDSKKYKPYLKSREFSIDQQEIINFIHKYSQLYNVDAKLVQAVLQIESNYDYRAQSKEGAQGLMQIMPYTQKELGLNSPFDPEANIKAGIRYLKKMMEQFSCIEYALAAYNAGPNSVRQYKGIPPFPETKKYIQKVLQIYNRLKTCKE